MAISDKLTKLSTDITNAYNSIQEKGGTIPTNKNTENLIQDLSENVRRIINDKSDNSYDKSEYLEQYKDNIITVFLLSVVICSVLEYFTSYIMEKLFKTRLWDYIEKLKWI